MIVKTVDMYPMTLGKNIIVTERRREDGGLPALSH
jgi:hypothetical protein